VKAAITVAGSDLAKAASERYDFLTLEQAAAVAEFQEDGEAVKRLIFAAQRGSFDHTVQQLREDREEEAAIAKTQAELLKDGITVVEVPLAHPARRSFRSAVRRRPSPRTPMRPVPATPLLSRPSSTTTTMKVTPASGSPRSLTSAPTRLPTGTSKQPVQPPMPTSQGTPAPRTPPRKRPERNAAESSPTTRHGELRVRYDASS
jgi:hypothetical protein